MLFFGLTPIEATRKKRAKAIFQIFSGWIVFWINPAFTIFT